MSSKRLSFVSFGMFIIDEIEYTDGREREQDLIGGAGTYAALGARLAAASSAFADSVSWIVDIGSDFPPQIKSLIESWNTSCVFRYDNTRLTTRAWNGYGANEHRAFKYLTPKIRLEVESLSDEQALASSFHMVCSPSRCTDLSTKLRQRRQQLERDRNQAMAENIPNSDPIIVWEPIPDLCTPAELAALRFAATHVSIVSPNADELAQFFDTNSRGEMTQSQMVSELMGWQSPLQSSQQQANSRGPGLPCVIVREGAKGSTIYLPASDNQIDNGGHKFEHAIKTISISAYHDRSMSARVIDPTGGGNTYLGALAQALSPFNTYRDQVESLFASTSLTEAQLGLLSAAIIATIAASYAIEQCGVPILGPSSIEVRHQRSDIWNGEAFAARLSRYLDREKNKILAQIL